MYVCTCIYAYATLNCGARLVAMLSTHPGILRPPPLHLCTYVRTYGRSRLGFDYYQLRLFALITNQWEATARCLADSAWWVCFSLMLRIRRGQKLKSSTHARGQWPSVTAFFNHGESLGCLPNVRKIQAEESSYLGIRVLLYSM